ncbi:hypothetical protein SM124_10780 [Bacillus sp. 31A1R]|uniref:Uncharacterized protein n=1 Tax=Robertmurraya mangrovi TaxID=3098077 RepID=A0ABU5IYL5_9BACI|nr:hypothetical protein [Bacillus sp. 31A1R]MDZ5472232.1 hypothetical protein [Bacillus sp. 31A1R]
MNRKLMIRMVSLGLIICMGYLIFNLFVPQSPIKSISNTEVLTKAIFSDKVLTPLGDEGEYTYYITKHENGAFKQKVIDFMMSKDYSFLTQEGSGLFFEKEDKEVVLTTQMWTRKYVILKVPNID